MESKNTDKKQITTTGNKKVNAKKQAEYVRFMFLTITAGVLMCILIFFIVFSSVNNKNKNKVTTTETQTTIAQTEPTTLEKIDAEILAVILNVSTDNKKINLYNIEQDKELSLIMSAGAEMKDQYGSSMTLAEFVSGDIVEVIYDENSMQYNTLKISSKGWKQHSITGLKVNAQASTITSSNKVYKYDNKLISKYGKDNFDISQLDSIDVATIKGYKDVIYSVELEKGHGFLILSGKDKVKDGSVEIDTNIFRSLDDDDKIKVTEGEHKLVIKGSNIEAYTKQFSVNHGKEVTIDLSDAELKLGVVVVKTNVNDYILYVNDEQRTSGEPLMLNYGKYNIKLTKEGYHEVTSEILVDKNSTTLELTMEKIDKILMGELSVTTIPENDANIFVDNAYVGISPLTIKLEYGEHSVTVKKEGYTDINISITISEVPKKVEVTLHQIISNTTKPTTETKSGINVTPVY